MKKNLYFLISIMLMLCVSILNAQDKKDEADPKPSIQTLPQPAVANPAAKTPVAAPTISPTPSPTPTPLSENEFHFFYSGNRKSEIEPCGCKSKNLGGLEYEMDIYKKQKSAGVNFMTLDSGGFIDVYLSDIEKLKTRYMMDIFNNNEYNVMNVSADDLAMGIKYLKSIEEKEKVSFVSANLYDQNDKRIFNPYKVFDVQFGKEGKKKIKIGVIGVTKTPAPLPGSAINRPVVPPPGQKMQTAPGNPTIIPTPVGSPTSNLPTSGNQIQSKNQNIPTVPGQNKTQQPGINAATQNLEIPENSGDFGGFDANPDYLRQTQSSESLEKKKEIEKKMEEFRKQQMEQMIRMGAPSQTNYNSPVQPPQQPGETNYNAPGTRPEITPDSQEKPVWKQLNYEIPGNKNLDTANLKSSAPADGCEYSEEETARFGLGGSGDPVQQDAAEKKDDSQPLPASASLVNPSPTPEQKPKSEFVVKPYLEEIQKVLPELREKCDIVILLSFTGNANAKLIAQQVTGIDIIISGDYSRIIPEPEKVNSTYMVHPGYQGKYLGDLAVSFAKNQDGKWIIDKIQGRKIDIDKEKMPADPETSKLIKQYKEDLKELRDKGLGTFKSH